MPPVGNGKLAKTGTVDNVPKTGFRPGAFFGTKVRHRQTFEH